jgi:hypothetical protein
LSRVLGALAVPAALGAVGALAVNARTVFGDFGSSSDGVALLPAAVVFGCARVLLAVGAAAGVAALVLATLLLAAVALLSVAIDLAAVVASRAKSILAARGAVDALAVEAFAVGADNQIALFDAAVFARGALAILAALGAVGALAVFVALLKVEGNDFFGGVLARGALAILAALGAVGALAVDALAVGASLFASLNFGAAIVAQGALAIPAALGAVSALAGVSALGHLRHLHGLDLDANAFYRAAFVSSVANTILATVLFVASAGLLIVHSKVISLKF